MPDMNPTWLAGSLLMRKVVRRGVLLGTGIFCLLLLAVTPVVTSQDDDAFEAELVKGRTFMRRSLFEDALKSFKRANEMRDKKCIECLNLMAEAYLGLEAYKNVVETSDKIIELGSNDKQLLMKAYNNKGLALQTWADRKDQKRLQAAEATFRQGLAIEGAPAIMRYNLGFVLLQMNRDQEGVAELQQYLKLQPNGSNAENTKRLIDNPRRAREDYAPDFSFTSLDGEHFALEDLKGKVILLDFWGTWCPPCVESVPELRNLHKKYSKEPSFVLIGISSDSNDEVWREFTVKNKMPWTHYRDKDRKIQRAFRVHTFPTYIVIDHEGIVQQRIVGLTYPRSSALDDAVRKQVKIVAKSPQAQ